MRRILFLSFFLAAIPAFANDILSGPMAGYSAMRSVAIWLQAQEPGEVQLEYWPVSNSDRRNKSEKIELRKSEDNVTKIEIKDLEPDTTYRYRVILDGVVVEHLPELKFQTQSLWQWRKDAPDFNVLVGSCAYINDLPYDRPGSTYGGGYEIFSAMTKKQANMVLWLGDNLYFREADYSSPWGMAYRYRKDRSLPELQPLLQTGHHYAIWDDHDYGPNDSNSSFIFKGESLNLFKRYWANPSFGLPEAPGIFTKVSFNDVDFFLLDDRFYRDHDFEQNSKDKAMFGSAQMKWLRNALLDSTAAFKVIAAGGEMLNEFGDKEGWKHFPDEKNNFLSWLGRSRINGVMFLSGDRHLTALAKYPREKNYPLYELTCSPLTSGPRSASQEKNRPNAVEGTLVGARNFCELEFSGKKATRTIKLRSFDSQGKLNWERSIALSELSDKAQRP